MEDKMKKIVVWLSTSSRVSWLQVWKQMHSWLSLPISTCWWWEETQLEVEERRYSRISCYSEWKTSKVVHLKTQIQWILLYGKLEDWYWTLRRDTPEILRMHLVQNWIRERQRQSGGMIQKGEPHERNPCEKIAHAEQERDLSSCMRETDADRSWQAGHGKPWTNTRFFFRRDEQGRSNARHFCLVTALHS